MVRASKQKIVWRTSLHLVQRCAHDNNPPVHIVRGLIKVGDRWYMLSDYNPLVQTNNQGR